MAQTVNIGEWVQVRIPDGVFPVYIVFDNETTDHPAFIDRVPGGVVAQVRAPAGLRRGKHTVTAKGGDKMWKTTFEVR